MGKPEFNSKGIFLNNNLSPGIAIVSTDIFNELKEKKL